ncbi:hypothetical protein AGMMS4952_02820 [Spirochaetia bacterium]|nr:hypothetical protein AGMMS4952_02820 [Spirochaetia bacterium]
MIRRKHLSLFLALILVCVLFTACGDDSTDDPAVKPPPNTESEAIAQPPIDPSDPSTKTIKDVVGGGQRIIHEVWMGIDTNTDPRNPIGYKLKTSGKQYFDNVVIFHADLKWQDCNSTNEAGHNWCPKTGIHLHFPDETQWLLNEPEKYLQPLKDAGFKVLIGLLPGGNGLCFGTLGSWPMESVYPWETNEGGTYPADEQKAMDFAKEVADFCAGIGSGPNGGQGFVFDGIAMDDEYGSQGEGAPADGSGQGKFNVYPETSAYPGLNASAAWSQGGENVFRFCRYFKDLTTDAAHPNGKWVSNYEYHYLASLPASLMVKHPTTKAERTFPVDEVIDLTYPASYGAYVANSGIGASRSHYGPLSLKYYESPGIAAAQVKGNVENILKGGYGAMMYFALLDRNRYSSATYFGQKAGTQAYEWFTRIAQVLYKDDVIYEPPSFEPTTGFVQFPSAADYPGWAQPGITNGSGALYGHGYNSGS